MKIEHMTKPEQKIVSITKTTAVVDLPKFIGPTFMKLAGYIEAKGARVLSAPFVSFKGMSEDGIDCPEAVEVEIGFPIDKIIGETDEVKSYLMPSYDAVTAHYVGKYEDMTPIYMEMMAEIKASGKTFSGNSYEYYLSDEEVPPENQETILELPYC